MKYQEIEGDLVELAKQGRFDLIAHGCNCFCRMKRGIAPQMAEAFSCDRFIMEDTKLEGAIQKLGNIDFKSVAIGPDKTVCVVNCYSQYHWDTKTKPLDYEALTLCLRKINHTFKGEHIGLPLIGCHLAGGVWDYTEANTLSEIEYHEFKEGIKIDVKTIIKWELKDMDITIVHYKP